MLQKLLLFTFYLILFLLPTQLGKHFWPDFTIVSGFTRDYLSPTLYLTDLLIFIFAILSFRFIKITPLFKFKALLKKYQFKSLLRQPLFLLLISLLISTILTPFSLPNALLALLTLGKLSLLAYLIIQIKFNLTTIQTILAATLLYTLLIVVFQFNTQASLNGPLYWLGERTFSISTPGIAKSSLCDALPYLNQWIPGNCQLFMRPYATFSHPNSLAGYSLITFLVIFLITCATSQQTSANRTTKASHHPSRLAYLTFPFVSFKLQLAYIVSSIIIILSLSRTAILAWVITSLAIITLKLIPRLKVQRQLTYPTTIASFLMLIAFPFILQYNISPSVSPYDQPSFSLRSHNYQSALQLIQTYPLFGVGPGNTIPALASLPDFPASPRTLQPIHNLFLHLTTQIGLVGVSLVIITTHWFFRKYKESSFQLLSPSFLLLTAFLITATTDHYWYTLHQNQLLLAITVGLLYKTKRKTAFQVNPSS